MTHKYDITKYLESNTVDFKPQLKTFIKKGQYDGDWKYQDLNTWYEIEKLFVESWKDAGGEFENYKDKRGWFPKGRKEVHEEWRKLTGLDKINCGRVINCFYGDISTSHQ